MTQISALLNPLLDTPLSIGERLICVLAEKWASDLVFLCQPMQPSPSTLHHLGNISEDALPSFVLLQQGLLFDERGQKQIAKQYDRKAYVELNRAMSSVIALFYLLRGDCYESLVEGQHQAVKLSQETYRQLHQQCCHLLQNNGVWNESLLDIIFYATLFNDMGKSRGLKQLLHRDYQIKEHDHDLIFEHAMTIEGLLKDFSQLTAYQQDSLRTLWCNGFNVSSFDTLEYSPDMIVNWVILFADKAKDSLDTYLMMKKIEILTDIAGANGNRCRGAINLTEPVALKFEKSFELLQQLFTVYQQQSLAKNVDKASIYSAIRKKIDWQLQEQAKNLAISGANELMPQTVLVLRLCKMLGISDRHQTGRIYVVLAKIEQNHPADYRLLEQEFAWAHNAEKPGLWLECVPKFLWLMSNGHHYNLINPEVSPSDNIGKQHGLYAGLLIISKALNRIRQQNDYQELYGFKEHQWCKVSSISQPLEHHSTIALYSAYDLVVMAQQASLVNPDETLRQVAIDSLKLLWRQGAMIKGRRITISPSLSENKQSIFFNKSLPSPESIIDKQQSLLQKLSSETDAHRAYLASIDLADRADCFKVSSFIYQDTGANSVIDIRRFNSLTPLPDIVAQFDIKEPNTLFASIDYSEQSQQEKINRCLDIRLYPSIRTLIKQYGAKVFLGSNIDFQEYTKSRQETVTIKIDVPSSVKFYIAFNQQGDIQIYLSGLVSHENLIQQLITLKLAGIDLQTIPILGDTRYYELMCQNDLLAFKQQAQHYMANKNVLIVAGCSLEDMVCSTLEQLFAGTITKESFSGDLVSLSYVQSKHAPDLGFIVLNLNYGDICEQQVTTILNHFHCIGLFTGSAAGYIPKDDTAILPDIGERLAINATRHYLGEEASHSNASHGLHLQVPTPFVETVSWLNKAKHLGATTVDVETFYIVKALQNYQRANPLANIHADIGVFISDYVGKKPLESYKNVFEHYAVCLNEFIQQVLVSSLTSTYSHNHNSTPSFSSHYVGLTPAYISIDNAIKQEAVVDSIGKYWDKSEFSKRVHTPVSIGSVKDKQRFTQQGVARCLHLPVKLPGSDIRIPIEYEHFLDELQQIFNFEVSINPGWQQLYAYLTVDQGFVPRANSQRVPGPHVDGMPRDRTNPEAQIIDHAYLVTNAIPTMFYTQQFDMTPYDPEKHHFFAIFRALSDESRTITANPYSIALMDAYSVHTPTQTQEDVVRTFIRLEFSTLKFDRLGNSINPHFSHDENFPDYPFHYIPRPIPEHLFVPPAVYLNKPITHQDYRHESIDQFGRAMLKAVFLQDPRYRHKQSSYKNLDTIANDIMNQETKGIIVCQQGIPHAFFLYQIENHTVLLHTLFTLTSGKGQEMMIYGMTMLQKIADRLALQAGKNEGDIPITLVINDNNSAMQDYFLRVARLSKMRILLKQQDNELLVDEPPFFRMTMP